MAGATRFRHNCRRACRAGRPSSAWRLALPGRWPHAKKGDKRRVLLDDSLPISHCLRCGTAKPWLLNKPEAAWFSRERE